MRLIQRWMGKKGFVSTVSSCVKFRHVVERANGAFTNASSTDACRFSLSKHSPVFVVILDAL